MGKQGRRKQRQRKKRDEQQQQQHEQLQQSTMNRQVIANTSSAIHQLRHVDPKVRHNALVALQVSFLHPNKRINLNVLQAVREQIMDTNLECASAASECLAEYISLQAAAAAAASTTTTTNDGAGVDNTQIPKIHRETMAGWTLVLLQRLDQCHQGLQSPQQLRQQQQQQQTESSNVKQGKKNKNNNKNKNSNNKNNKNTKGNTKRQWFALAASTVRALCKLIEVNELALDQIMRTQKETFLSTLFGLLDDARQFYSSSDSSNVASAASSNDMDIVDTNNKTSASAASSDDGRLEQWVHETAAFAARTLHSSLDDNEELVQMVYSNDKCLQLWPILMKELPDLTQLHLSGCLVTVYSTTMMMENNTNYNNNDSTKIHTLIRQLVIPCLTKHLIVHVQDLEHLYETYRIAKRLWIQQKEDDDLEQQVIRCVQDRREPAKLIARRQKQNPRTNKNGKVKMNDDDKDETATTKNPAERQEDGRQAMQNALMAWNNTAMVPMQVALEVATNLLSSLVPLETDDGMIIDGLQQQEGVGGRGKMDVSTGDDDVIIQALVDVKWSERLIKMFQGMGEFQQGRHRHRAVTKLDNNNNNINNNNNDDDDNNSDDEMHVLDEDIDEIISKIAGCLTNCVLSNKRTMMICNNNNNNGINIEHVWKVLRPHVLQRGVCSAMIVLVKATSTTTTMGMTMGMNNNSSSSVVSSLSDYIIQHDLEPLFFSKLFQQKNNNTKNHVIDEVQRDAISLLTIVMTTCTIELSVEMVTKITNELLRLLRQSDSSMVVKIEILSTIMDLYGQDDYHPTIFVNLHVLKHFQNGIKVIQSNGGRNNFVITPEDEEIIYNAHRFVEYMIDRY